MASPSHTNDDQAELLRVLNEYYSAFSTLNIEAVLPYFHEPSLLIGPQGTFAATTHASLTTAIAPVLEGLRARGLGRTELSVRNLKLLSATARRGHIAAGLGVRGHAGSKAILRHPVDR